MFSQKPIQQNHNINLLEPELKLANQLKIKKRAKTLSKAVAYFVIACFIIGLGLFSKIIISSSELAANFGHNNNIFSQLKNLFLSASPAKTLKGEGQDRINILLLGIGGADHPGPYLTDTIILASIKPSTKQVALLSIPRDLSAPINGRGYAKINSAYAIGKNTGDAYAGELAKQTVSSVTGQDIHYYGLLDFSGFAKIIDALGGVDIEVEKDFYDPLFPTTDFKTQTVTFSKGLNHFDGHEALTYARSRHGNNNEGSDFARAKRQQQVILAIRNQALSLGLFLQPAKIDKLLNILNKSVKTDLEIWEIVKLYQLVKSVDSSNIAATVIEEEPLGPLKSIVGQGGAFLLVDTEPNYANVKKIANNLFAGSSAHQSVKNNADLAYAPEIENIPPSTPAPIKIILQNGTNFPGLASYFKDKIDSEIFPGLRSNKIIAVENAQTRDFEKAVIYILNDQSSKLTEPIKILRELLNANIAATVPAYLNNRSSEADLVIVLGKDQISKIVKEGNWLLNCFIIKLLNC